MVKHNARRYGKVLDVYEPLPPCLEFQLLDVVIQDEFKTYNAYNTRHMTKRTFAQHVYDMKTHKDNDDDDDNNMGAYLSSLTKLRAQACLFGRTMEGYSISVHCNYMPYLYLISTRNMGQIHLNQMKKDILNVIMPRSFQYREQNRSKWEKRVFVRRFDGLNKQLFGYTPDPSDPLKPQRIYVVEVMFTSLRDYKRFFWYFKKTPNNKRPPSLENVQIAEGNVDHSVKFCDKRNLVISGWVKMQNYTQPAQYWTHTQIECRCRFRDLSPVPDKSEVAPLLVASVDIESYSYDYSFPQAEKTHDYVITIGVSLWRTNETDASANNLERFVFCLGETHPVSNATVFWFHTERALLEGWRDFMTVYADPDVVLGYNIIGFDWKYMSDRIQTFYTATPTRNRAGGVVMDKPVSAILQAKEKDSSTNTRKAMIEQEYKWRKQYDPQNVVRAQVVRDDQITTSLPHVPSHFFYLGRLIGQECLPDTRMFSSSAYGDRENVHLHMSGRFVVDLLQYVRREHKLRSYKLDSIVSIFLKDRKIDLPYKLMMVYFERGPTERAEIAEYCLKDCDLPIRLLYYFCAIPNLVELSRVTYTSLNDIIIRGQQIKVFNQLVHYAHRNHYVLNNPPEVVVGSYEGATVVDPQRGLYINPVATLDFASLYPSIIRDKNLCYSTFILNQNDAIIQLIPSKYINKIRVDASREYWFVNHIQGILPKMEETLLKTRKRVKKQMKQVPYGSDVYKMLNGKQLAIKVSCNSIYGFTGANNGMYPCKPIAESITSRGREMIELTREEVESFLPDCHVIYGDSVASYTPLVLRYKKHHIRVMTIEELWGRIQNVAVSEAGGYTKDYTTGDHADWETWTDQGWTPIRRIMRHRHEKPLVRICSSYGVVDVTQDHSLLKYRSNDAQSTTTTNRLFRTSMDYDTQTIVVVKPQDLKPTDVLVHAPFVFPKYVDECYYEQTPADVSSFSISNPIHIIRSKITGFFWSAGVIVQNTRLVFCVPPSKQFMVQDILHGLQTMFPRATFNRPSNNVIFTTDDHVVHFFIVHVYNGTSNVQLVEGKGKRVPNWVLNAPFPVQQAFWTGLSYGLKDSPFEAHAIRSVSAVSIMDVYVLIHMLGFHGMVRVVSEEKNTYYYELSVSLWSIQPETLTKTPLIPKDTSSYYQFVYDLETHNHHFQAGVGQIIVHNTDSVMVHFPKLRDTPEDIKTAFQAGIDAAAHVTNTFGEAVELEMEKIYCPYMLFKKKRYIGLMYEEPTKPTKIDTKGIEVVRRDSPLLTHRMYNLVINKLFWERDYDNVIPVFMQKMKELVEDEGKSHYEEFIMSRNLKSTYKNPDALAHVRVVEDIRRRNPGTEPQVGDRVQYVICCKIEGDRVPDKICNRAYEPEYALKNKNLQLDLVYYIEKHIQKPLTQFFNFLTIRDANNHLRKPKDIFDPIIRFVQNKRRNERRKFYFTNTSTSSKSDLLDDIPHYRVDMRENIVPDSKNKKPAYSKKLVEKMQSSFIPSPPQPPPPPKIKRKKTKKTKFTFGTGIGMRTGTAPPPSKKPKNS